MTSGGVWKVGGGIPRHGKRDIVEKDVIDALVEMRCYVVQNSMRGVPDLLVAYPVAFWEYKTVLIEVKSFQSSTLTLDQRDFFRWWPGDRIVVYSAEDAIKQLENMGAIWPKSAP